MGREGNAILIDLDRGIIGSFEGVDHHTGDPGFVFIKYVPFNSLKTVRYKQPVREVDCHRINNKHSSLAGASDDIFLIFEGKNDSLFSGIGTKYQKRVRELEKQIEDLRLELASAKQRAETAQSGAKKIISEASEINKGSRQRSPFGGLGGFGGMDDY